MPNPFLVPIMVIWSVVPQVIDKLLGTNIEQYFTQELLGDILWSPIYLFEFILAKLFT